MFSSLLHRGRGTSGRSESANCVPNAASLLDRPDWEEVKGEGKYVNRKSKRLGSADEDLDLWPSNIYMQS